MIDYDMPLFRPPSEADSLIFQATLGCSHNRCAFCVMYRSKRFHARPEKELFAEIDWAGENLPETRRVFLADGDALALSATRMIPILERLYRRFPRLERVSAYASPQNFLRPSLADLASIREAGLTLLYFGLESGDDEVLLRIHKGATCEEMVQACHKAHEAGFDLSLTVLLGLAGPSGSDQHAQRTAAALDRIRPKYASALTLMLVPIPPSYSEIYGDPSWRLLDTAETLQECRTLLEHMHASGIIFRSNHASNYVALRGTLPQDKERMLGLIDRALSDPRSPLLRPEFLRAL